MVKTLFPRIIEKAELTFLKPPIDVTCELISIDNKGRIIGRRKFRSHSFVSNFIQLLYCEFNNPASTTSVTTGKDINGNTRTFVQNQGAGTAGIAPGVAATGANIVVGTGSTTPAFGDFQMGGFAGRVFASLGAPLLAATSKFTITGTVSFATATTINEVGLDVPLTYSPASTAASFLLVHDNVSGGFAVSAGGSITVVYTISVTT